MVFTRGAIRGASYTPTLAGAHVQGESERDRQARSSREHKARKAQPAFVRVATGSECGSPMKASGQVCARGAGHGWEHRSRLSLDNAARYRRACVHDHKVAP